MWVGRKLQIIFKYQGAFDALPHGWHFPSGFMLVCVMGEFSSGIIALMTRNPHLSSRSEKNASLSQTCLLVLPEKPFYESGIKARRRKEDSL